MASIFTYDPDPPRVSSPWLGPEDSQKRSTSDSGQTSSSGVLEDYGVTRLEAEPQEGPTEYKLHLLLRPRRPYSSSSTGSIIAGSQQNRQQSANQISPASVTPILAPSNTARQKRLEQLTTQLLWRLQQTCPFHTSAPNDLVLPQLPEATETLTTPSRPGKLIAGLEGSRGALYEIGVSDDGTLVGLTEDEMDESLTNLKAMAASLGCSVQVLRKVVVGHCTWQEKADAPSSAFFDSRNPDLRLNQPREGRNSLRHKAQLWVAEAFITPELGSRRISSTDISKHGSGTISTEHHQAEIDSTSFSTSHDHVEQLRVTLTGPTTSGKSSLLGVLSMATLDNGRGMSRLSLLKHRHEIETGVTSSVAQELIGYRASEVVNYASDDINSWSDIQDAADHRVVFVSDSAGHPRYRRTTVRGLVGCAPHWVLLCIAADDGDNISNTSGGTCSAEDVLAAVGFGVDLVKAHLDLCLKLERPLAIVITKLDLASKSTLRQNLSKILSAIKEVGRTPTIIPPPEQAQVITAPDLQHMFAHDIASLKASFSGGCDGLTSIVPIVMTSAVKGTGIRQLHAMLKSLPVPPRPTAHDLTGLALNPEQPSSLFHIEDIFGVPASYDSPTGGQRTKDAGSVVAGHVRFGYLSIGAIVVVGPFPSETDESESPSNRSDPRSSPTSFGTIGPHSSATDLARMTSRSIVSASVTKGEWYNAQIVSIRNLRRPVQMLEAGQVGTIGLIFDVPTSREHRQMPRIRKGMVVAMPSRHMLQTKHTLQAASGFTASFEDSDINSVTSGSLVVVYIASIRAPARIVSLSPHDAAEGNTTSRGFEDVLDVFGPLEQEEPLIFGVDGVTDVTFELLTNREWIELGSQVLCMPGGGHGLYHGSGRGEKGIAGLEGFVGRILEVVE